MNQYSGATLTVTLLLLFVISILGISAIQVTQFQEKMASNLQDKELSFNAAETALSAGENWILSQNTAPTPLSICGLYPCVHVMYQNVDFKQQTDAWWAANSAAYGTQLQDITTAPRYIVEYVQFVPDSPEIGNTTNQNMGTHYYQITARGTGNTDNAVTVLQTTVGRRF